MSAAVLRRARTRLALPPFVKTPGVAPIDIVDIHAHAGLARHLGGRAPPLQTV